MAEISDNDLASFLVCPEAWRLKHAGQGEKQVTETMVTSLKDREEWKEKHSQFAEIKLFARVVYVLLFMVFLTVYMLDQLGRSPVQLTEFLGIPQQVLVLLLLLAGTVFLTDVFERKAKDLGKDTGLDRSSELFYEEVPLLTSKDGKFSSQPDAIIKEGDLLVPVDRVPTQKKVRDRHVIKMLLHLKLLSEREEKEIPYGLLVMGSSKRQSKILNSEERQNWLSRVIHDLEEVKISGKAEAKPQYNKCKGCDVTKVCKFSAYKSKD